MGKSNQFYGHYAGLWLIISLNQSSPWLATQVGAAMANFAAQKVIIDYVFCRYYPSNNTVEAFISLPLIHRLWISVIHLALGWLFLANASRLIAIIAVATRLSVPENCPPSFGSLAECYTVRNFWGKAWHQTFKWYFNTTGDLVATSIGAKKGTLLRKYTKLHVAFLMSGIQHYVATLFVPSASWAWAMIGQMVLYAIIVTIEDGLKSLGQQVGLKPGRKLIITPALRRNSTNLIPIQFLHIP